MGFFEDVIENEITESNNYKHSIWVEKYRPTDLNGYIGNDHVKERFSTYIKTNDPPHVLLYGRAGTGKTTLAKILAKNIKCDYLYINASDDTGVDIVRDKIRPYAQSVGLHGLKIVILDEFDYMTPNAQAALRNIMETFIDTTRFILTCNYVEKIIEPIISRVKTGMFEIYPPGRKELAVHAVSILDREQITYELTDVATLVNVHFPDIRGLIGALQLNSVDGKLSINSKTVVENDFKLKYVELLQTVTNKKECYTKIRQLFADNHVSDFSDLYKLLYDTVDEIAPGNTAEMILEIAQAQKDDYIVLDKEINAMAFTIRLITLLKGN